MQEVAGQVAVALDAAQAADAAFDAVAGKPFPRDIFDAPELRWGVVGCGVMARQMAQSLGLAGRKLLAVTNRTVSKAQAFAEEFGVERVYETADDLFADPDVDAVYITTPHNTHITFLRGALAAGKHVLCEKAITLNSDELDEARALAHESATVLMDATTVLHMPLYRALRLRADAGEFGRLRLVQANFGSFHSYDDEESRFWNRSLAGGALLDIGVYAFSVARLFMDGAPSEVVSLGNLASTGVDEEGGVVCRTTSGQLGVFSLSMHAKQPKRVDLCFDDCYIEVMAYPRADRATIVWTADGRREEVRAGEEGYALCYEVADLERAVAGDTGHEALMSYTADVMDLMTSLRGSWGVVYPEEE